MAYTTYSYYSTTYCAGRTPSISSSEFDYYEKLAELFIKEATLEKSDSYTGTELQDCTCAVADKYKAFDTEDKYLKGGAVGITSEKVGEYSVNYGGISTTQIESVKSNELRNILKLYLGMTGLLFRGA